MCQYLHCGTLMADCGNEQHRARFIVTCSRKIIPRLS